MTPSKILNIYYLATFAIGSILTLVVAFMFRTDEIGPRGAFGLILCWNVLFVMLLPLMLDWAERRYMKARFMAIEDIAKSNPELAAQLDKRCQELSIPALKLAIVDTKSDELFSYGIWGSNPRLMVPENLIAHGDESKIVPSIEAELTRFSRRDHTVIYLIFAGVQAVVLALALPVLT